VLEPQIPLFLTFPHKGEGTQRRGAEPKKPSFAALKFVHSLSEGVPYAIERKAKLHRAEAQQVPVTPTVKVLTHRAVICHCGRFPLERQNFALSPQSAKIAKSFVFLLFSATENFSTWARALLSYLADKTDFRRGNAQAK